MATIIAEAVVIVGIICVLALLPMSPLPAAAQAFPNSSPTRGERVSSVAVHSPSMNRDIDLTVITPADNSRPRGVLYLMNGAAGGENEANWLHKTDLVRFLADKDVYVVIPTQGAYTYYTDWLRSDPRLGVNKWSTFLGEELPSIIDSRYPTNGHNVIAGISGSATSALNLAIEHPGRFRAVASYSGCAATSDAFGQLAVRSVVELRGQSDATNMWGAYGGPVWRAHDPVVHADKLRGLTLFLSSASGLPGEHDSSREVPDPAHLIDQLAVGGGIEAATMYCTRQLQDRLENLGIPATFDFVTRGTHSWPYFQEAMHRSWPFLAPALGD
ncbi:alpha/beta hydrolase family protein [Gordonia sp. NB41Y]|uniref:alpha/beta hydrolase n=1 Tax=Gordonia sp. NB41Y TaxID=875808 RepID=UPI0002BEC7E7|nr:alpha/beta hydrolase family protein [Gordonia sp. NB41Y]EMP12460.1 esterase [Gordonia sp. NB41Y]WLP92702.1 alpha/beta hydrolase family protein [Gordonia sp. NB41Y]